MPLSDIPRPPRKNRLAAGKARRGSTIYILGFILFTGNTPLRITRQLNSAFSKVIFAWGRA
jgi:hypothetical protein